MACLLISDVSRFCELGGQSRPFRRFVNHGFVHPTLVPRDSTPDATMDYDAAGRLLTNSTSVATLVYTYDDVNQLLSETQAVGSQSSRTVSYTYDDDGNRLSLTYPGGTVVTNTFTGRNALSALYVDGTSLGTFAYDAAGRV